MPPEGLTVVLSATVVVDGGGSHVVADVVVKLQSLIWNSETSLVRNRLLYEEGIRASREFTMRLPADFKRRRKAAALRHTSGPLLYVPEL